MESDGKYNLFDMEKNKDILSYFNKHIKEKMKKGQQKKKEKENNKKNEAMKLQNLNIILQEVLGLKK